MTRCTNCQVVKTRFWSGSIRKNGNKIYVDDTGRQWNSRWCADCGVARTRKYRNSKPKIISDLGPDILLDPLTHRKCRSCGKRLPKSRYFLHDSCVPYSSHNVSEEYLYNG